MDVLIKTKEDVINFLQESDQNLKSISAKFDPAGDVISFSFDKFEYKFKIPGGVEVK